MSRKHSLVLKKIGWYAATAFIALHGIAHFVGTMIIFDPTHELYSTTILWDTIDLGNVGFLVWGGLYTASGVVFVVSAVGMVLHRWWWKRLLFSVTILSLLLTFGDLDLAYTGFVINVVIMMGFVVNDRVQ